MEFYSIIRQGLGMFEDRGSTSVLVGSGRLVVPKMLFHLHTTYTVKKQTPPHGKEPSWVQGTQKPQAFSNITAWHRAR